MDTIKDYIKTDEDIALEYELQQTAKNKITWQRYIDLWIDTGRSDTDIRWLFERYTSEFIDDVEVWKKYIQWESEKDKNLIDINRLYGLYTRSIEHCKNGKDNLVLSFLKLTIEQGDLKSIREVLDLSLLNLKKNLHWKVWTQILEFINNKLVPFTKSDVIESEENLEIENNFNMKSQIETAIDIYMNSNNNDNNNKTRELDMSDSIEPVDIWSSRIIQRYLIVASQSEVTKTLQLLFKTRDYKSVISTYQKYLTKDTNTDIILPNLDLPYDINHNYLISLNKSHSDNDYKEFIEELKKIYPEKLTHLTLEHATFLISRCLFNTVQNLLDKQLEIVVKFNDFHQIYSFFIYFELEYCELLTSKNIQLTNAEDDNSNTKTSDNLQAHRIKLEYLIDNDKLLINNILIRQDTNKVENWLERAKLYKDDIKKCEIYVKAIESIIPQKVRTPSIFGKLWYQYGNIYWESNEFEKAREIWDRGLMVPYPSISDLEEIYLNWAKKELDRNGIERAVSVLKNGIKIPENPEIIIDRAKNEKRDRKVPAQSLVFNSLRIWSTYIDYLEVDCSSTDNSDMSQEEEIKINRVIDAYEKTILLKLITPIMVANYARFLKTHNQKMKISPLYERAIPMFPDYIQYELWIEYLSECCKYHDEFSIETIRFFFQEAIRKLSSRNVDCFEIYKIYNDYELNNNHLPSIAVNILLEGAKRHYKNKSQYMPHKLELWQLCISECKEYLGSESCRELYEECIKTIPNSKATKFALEFAQLEVSLGETTRAREILTYGTELTPPAQNETLWEYFEQFELEYGDRTSFKSLLVRKNRLIEEAAVSSDQPGKIAFVRGR